MKLEDKLSWKGKAARIGAAILMPLMGFLEKEAKGQTYLTDFNKDGVVDTKDMTDFADAWLAESEGREVIPVYDCGCLDQAGKTYKLVTDLGAEWGLNSCLSIDANNVCIDLNRHKVIDSTSNTPYGIYCIGHSGLTIKNGQLKNFQQAGIYLENCNDALISDVNSVVTARYSSGISILRSNNGRMKDVNGHSFWPGRCGLLFSQVDGWEIINSEGIGDTGIHVGTRANSLYRTNGSTIKNSSFYGRVTDVSSTNLDNLFVDCEFESEVGLLNRASSLKIAVPGQNRAKVSVSNNQGLLEFLGHTNQKGEVPEIIVPWYSSINGQRENFGPYTIEVKGRYGKEAKKICDVNTPNYISISLD